MNFDAVLNQVFQPYFYYSVLFLVISLVCVKALLHFSTFLGQKTKSILYLTPLAAPIIVMLIFAPSAAIAVPSPVFTLTSGFAHSDMMHPNTLMFHSAPVFYPHTTSFTPSTLPPGVFVLAQPPQAPPILSVTGLLCIIGLALAGLFAVMTIAANDRVARRFLRVISISPEEYGWLQTKVAELSRKMSIATPKIGLVEDLRPNAFTIGYGKNTTIVFSIGLLNLLSKQETAAVASHELAHVKNHDFFYKVFSSSLTVVSFFNPFSYVASSAAQREREMLADEHAIAVLERPAALGDALAKICRTIEGLPKQRMLAGISLNLLVTSSVLHRAGLLSTHPRLDKRLTTISMSHAKTNVNPRSLSIGIFLSFIVLFSAMAVSLAMVTLQTDFASAHQLQPPSTQTVAYTTPNKSFILVSHPFTLRFDQSQMADTAVFELTSPTPNTHEPLFFVAKDRAGFDNGIIVVNASTISPQSNVVFL